MILESKTDVILGAGNPWYNNDGQPISTPNTYKYVGGSTTWDALVAGTAASDADGDGVAEIWTLIQARSEFQALTAGPTPERVVGVARAYTTMQQGRSGDAMAAAYVVPRNDTVPSLTEMTLAAINVLDNNPKGFALMVEGGAIDWAAHSNQPGRTIEEQVDFDLAVEAVVDWVETNSNWGETLLIVTGDHETGYLWGPGSDPTWQPVANNGAGVMPGMQFNSPNHTNSLIRMYAKGDVGRLFRTMVVGVDPVRGKYVDNTSIADVVFAALGTP
jgi:alkaline phosphatase